MDHQKRLTRSTFRIAGLTLLALFLIPALTYALSGEILRQWDQKFASTVAHDAVMEGRQGVDAFIDQARPSVVCHATAAEMAETKNEMCATFSNIWQVDMARHAAIDSMIGGAALLALVLVLSLAAFGSRSVQYVSFVSGKNLMIGANAVEVIVQGVMLVWLSFWVTAFFFNAFFVQLILIAAVAVALAVLMTIAGMFVRTPPPKTQLGELISEADAPGMWARIRRMADRLNTVPPTHVVAGIDANFYVTEAPLRVGDEALTGRTLYVSLPLLRRLDTSEADTVLAHELAHLSGGDTASSAKLGPALQHYDQYCARVGNGRAAIFVWPLLTLYRIVFELALARSLRQREFQADRVAAQLVSPQAIGKSLVKMAAYSIYRNEIEKDLFQHRAQHTGTLGIASSIDSGLAAYVQSAAFMDRIGTVHIPHPFDTHPPLDERMHAVGAPIGAQNFGTVAVEVPASSWVGEIPTADAIEGRLWNTYDQIFTAHHERSLAYRYRPSDEAELALVIKYFPTRTFALKNDETIEVSYAGIRSSKRGDDIPWEAIRSISYRSTSFGDSLVLVVIGPSGRRTTTIGLPRIGKSRDELKAVIGAYWQRHRVASQLEAAPG